jgi:hypothetical protein
MGASDDRGHELFGTSAGPKPWEIEPVLKPRRLVLLAQVAVETRTRAFAEANRDEGDTNWGLGCKAHERFAHALEKLAEGAESPWLRVRREGLAFSAFVEQVPVRVYRGSALRPPMKHVRAMAAERRVVDDRQLALFDAGPAPSPWFWMMAVETFADGQVRRAVFFQVDEAGTTRNHWQPPEGGLFGDDDEPVPARPEKKRKKAPIVETAPLPI